MGRFYVADSSTGTSVTVSPGSGKEGRQRNLFYPLGQVALPAVGGFVPFNDFRPPVAKMSENFRAYFCGRQYTNVPEVRIKPWATLGSVLTADIHEAAQSGHFRLPQTVHLFGLLKLPLSSGVVLSRRQTNLLYMMGTNHVGHLVTVAFVDGLWELDTEEPTSRSQWPAGTKIFFLV